MKHREDCNEEARCCPCGHDAEVAEIITELSTANKRIESLEATLQFYADPNEWLTVDALVHERTPWVPARKALTKAQELL